MKTNVEKQVAAFEKLLGHCNTFGAMYNPGKASLKVTAMTTLLTSAQQSVQAADTAKGGLILAVNVRQQVFDPLPKIGTRIVNALGGTDASPQLIADIKSIRDKFRYKGGGSQAQTAQPENSSQAQPIPADLSRGPLSQLDFESKIRNFGNMIQLLASEPTYKPNEPDLSIAGLNTLLATMREKHKAVINAQVALSNARLARKKVVYDANGISGTAQRVKNYVLSVYGSSSGQFRQVDMIHFRSK